MSDTFLSKDPVKALDQIKDRLYNRLVVSRQFLDNYGVDEIKDHNTSAGGFDRAVLDEIFFLQRLLDEIERS